MENTSGTNPKLIEENSLLKQKIKELEEYKAKFNDDDRALWKNDSFYHAFFDLAMDPMAITDFDTGRIIDVNQVFVEWSHHSRDELIGQTIAKLGFWVNNESRRAILDQLYNAGFIGDTETELRRGNGEIRQIIFSGKLIAIENGKCFLSVVRDITEHKQAEEALRDEKAKLLAIINATTDRIYLFDTEGTILAINNAGALYSRMGSDSVIGTNIFDRLTPDAAQKRKAIIQNICLSQQPFQFEYEQEGKWTDSYFFPVAVDGKVTRIVAHGRDITERKEMEEKVRASEMHYRRLFEAAKDGILIIDAETGKVEDVSPFTVEMLGYPRDELLGKHIWDIEFFKHTVLTEAAFMELRNSGNIYYNNLRLATKEGWHIIAELIGHVYLVDRKRIIQFNIRNISDLKWAEKMLKQEKEKLFTILENHPSGVALLGHDCTYQYINATFTEITGYTLDDIPTSRDWFIRAYPDTDYRHYVYSLWVNNLDRIEKREEEPVTLKVTCKDKTEKIINFISIQLRSNEYIITCRDVTKEKFAEEEREKLILELKKALSEVKTLSGLLPICASCKKIRNDKGYWEQIEDYIHDHSEAEFSHGICPECGEKLYSEYYKKK
jgi:PAS domain S-box-containing protein